MRSLLISLLVLLSVLIANGVFAPEKWSKAGPHSWAKTSFFCCPLLLCWILSVTSAGQEMEANHRLVFWVLPEPSKGKQQEKGGGKIA